MNGIKRVTNLKSRKLKRFLKSPVTMVFSALLLAGLFVSGGVAMKSFADGLTYVVQYTVTDANVTDGVTFSTGEPDYGGQPASWASGASPSLAAAPTAEGSGYTFYRWQVGDTLYEPGDTPDASLFTDNGSGAMTATATAVWKKYINITYEDPLSPDPSPTVSVPADGFNVPKPSRSGYTFTG